MNKRKMNIVLAVGLVFISVCILVYAFVRKNTLEKNPQLGVAVTYDYSVNGRGNAGGLNIEYAFNLNAKKYKATLALTTYELSAYNCKNYFIGTSFPVVYDPSNPSNSLLLIRPKDFKRFGIPFPDSLNWVLRYLEHQ